MNTLKEILDGYMERLETRFWEQVKKGPTCWNWLGTDFNGCQKYGYFSIHKKTMAAHRVAWILTHKFIPKGLHVLHHCDNRRCCNPKHLWTGTNLDNVKDKISKHRHGFGETASRAILTKKQVLEIRTAKCCRSGPNKLTDQMLATKYGISRRNIRSVRWGQTWKHLL